MGSLELRWAAILLCVFSLSACVPLVTSGVRNIDQPFEATQSKQGIFIFGISGQDNAAPDNKLESFITYWNQYPNPVPGGRTPIDFNKPFLPAFRPYYRWVLQDQTGLPEPPFGEMRYFLRFATSDAIHYLAAVSVERLYLPKGIDILTKSPFRTNVRTNYVRSETALVKNNIDEMIASNRVPNFKLQPGEIAYIGNFHLELSKDQTTTTRLLKYDFDEDAARKFLALHPRIKGEMTIKKLPLPGELTGEAGS